MQAALDAMTTELMLFGLASLLLNVFEGPITSICSEFFTSNTTAASNNVCVLMG